MGGHPGPEGKTAGPAVLLGKTAGPAVLLGKTAGPAVLLISVEWLGETGRDSRLAGCTTKVGEVVDANNGPAVGRGQDAPDPLRDFLYSMRLRGRWGNWYC
jgi:hypothetical protein